MKSTIIDLGDEFQGVPNPLDPALVFGRYQLWDFSTKEPSVVKTSDSIDDLQDGDSTIQIATIEEIRRLNSR